MRLLVVLAVGATATTPVFRASPSEAPVADQIPESSSKHIAVIGAGFSGLSAANELRMLGYRVTVFEKATHVGGRAHRVASPDGAHTFDAGPSWYWMPGLFDQVFARFGRRRADFYNLTRLEPAYRVVLPDGREPVDVPGTLSGVLEWADGRDPANSLRSYFDEARFKYERAVEDWLWKPMVSWLELCDLGLMRAGLNLHMFGSFEADLNGHTADATVREILKWPVIFIGASPADAPSMYSLMTYAGHAEGTWYPTNGRGMAAPAEALAQVAAEAGVEVRLGAPVSSIEFEGDRARAVCTEDGCDSVDAVVASADYHFVEQHLLPPRLRRYDERYWSRAILSPSCLLFYLGFGDDRVEGLEHHTFFFDTDLDAHLRDVFVRHVPTERPTFYVTAPSATDRRIADAALAQAVGGGASAAEAEANGETLFVLVPLSYTLNGTDTEEVRAEILQRVLARMDGHVRMQSGRSMADAMMYDRAYGPSDFGTDFNALRGNAFGLANTLSQSLVLKPSIDSLADNIVFAGHMTNPGPGVPPAMVSGIVAAQRLHERLGEAARRPSALYRLHSAVYATLAPAVWLIVRVLVALSATGLFLLAAVLLFSRRAQSWAMCVRLMYLHGRTYFAAATLMNSRRFLDTAAMYALFRVADDYVDDEYASASTRKNALEQFRQDFWHCWERRVGDYDRHPVLPAVIEACLRLDYPKELFDRFFKSMAMDAVTEHVCKDLSATYAYMEGSAAVIGDFMVPILMPDASAAERAAALPHARDLGNAFQLTNMIRDINEDLDLGRQYMPADLCARHGVDLHRRDAKQPGFVKLMEEMLDEADALYDSADIGISMLPANVSDVIYVARVLYHKIHDEIRAAGYNVFRPKRIRVTFRKKVKIATSLVTVPKIARIVATELFFLQLRLWLPLAAPLAVLLLTQWGLAPLQFPDAEFTYLRFHLVWTLPTIAFLGFSAWRHSASEVAHLRRAAGWIGVLTAVATVYTAPWDSGLVRAGVWGYAPGRVLAVVGRVPVEEIAFFTLETIVVGLVWLACAPDDTSLKLPPTPPLGCKSAARRRASSAKKERASGGATSAENWRNVAKNAAAAGRGPLGRLGTGFLLAIAAASGWSLLAPPVSPASSTQTTYLALILVWACPVLALQWGYGHRALMANWRVWIPAVLLSAAPLSVADQWAIRHDIWHIAPEFSLGSCTLLGLPDLPIEEATFFAATATMCGWGLTLAMVVSTQAARIAKGKHGGLIHSLALTRTAATFVCALRDVHRWSARDVEASRGTRKKASRASWLRSAHALLACLTGSVALVACGLFGYSPSFTTQVKFVVCSSMFLGMPHGALDPILLRAGVAGSGGRAGFLGGSGLRADVRLRLLARAWGPYLGTMGATWLLWQVAPRLALGLFLVMSAAHFGEGDVEAAAASRPRRGEAAGARFALLGGALEMFARGGAFLVATTAWPRQVELIFQYIAAPGQQLDDLMALLALLRTAQSAAAAIVLAAHMARLHKTRSALAAAEMVVVNALFYVCPPLLAFGVYFNVFHSLRHIIRVAEFAPRLVASRGKTIALLFTLLAVVPMLGLGVWRGVTIEGEAAGQWAAQWLRVVFMGLSVLTTPHMVLVGMLRLKEQLRSKVRSEGREDDKEASLEAVVVATVLSSTDSEDEKCCVERRLAASADSRW